MSRRSPLSDRQEKKLIRAQKKIADKYYERAMARLDKGDKKVRHLLAKMNNEQEAVSKRI